MNDIGIGAVGAAIIAGLVSLLGLIIGKEQKVSEFRQAWIDELRKCLVGYLVNINAIADAVRLSTAKKTAAADLSENYKRLNEAHHGIILRVNHDEGPSKALINSMTEFENIASNNATLTVKNIRAAEEKFLIAAKDLLKFEWKRVKRGEKTYYITKYIVIALIVVMAIIFAILWRQRDEQKAAETNSAQAVTGATSQMVYQINTQSGGVQPVSNRSTWRTQRQHAASKRVAPTVCKRNDGRTLRSTPETPSEAK